MFNGPGWTCLKAIMVCRNSQSGGRTQENAPTSLGVRGSERFGCLTKVTEVERWFSRVDQVPGIRESRASQRVQKVVQVLQTWASVYSIPTGPLVVHCVCVCVRAVLSLQAWLFATSTEGCFGRDRTTPMPCCSCQWQRTHTCFYCEAFRGKSVRLFLDKKRAPPPKRGTHKKTFGILILGKA